VFCQAIARFLDQLGLHRVVLDFFEKSLGTFGYFGLHQRFRVLGCNVRWGGEDGVIIWVEPGRALHGVQVRDWVAGLCEPVVREELFRGAL